MFPHTQVQDLENAAHPSIPPEVPETEREFLETEPAGLAPTVASLASPIANTTVNAARKTTAEGSCGDSIREVVDEVRHSTEGVGDTTVTAEVVGDRVVVYPARDGHASYHMPKR